MVQSYPAICGISSGLRVMSRVVNPVVNRLPRHPADCGMARNDSFIESLREAQRQSNLASCGIATG